MKTPPQTETLVHTGRTRTTGGREKGSARSSDGRLDVKLSPPGGPGTGTNSEQLFAAGWSACFESALGIAARHAKVVLPPDLAIDAEIDLNRIGGDDYVLRARLSVSLPGLDTAVARRLIDAAHRICPYSKATRGNIDVVVKLVQAGDTATVQGIRGRTT